MRNLQSRADELETLTSNCRASDPERPAGHEHGLNNVENLVKYYESKGEKVEIEFVAYGPGPNMVRSDTSPVKDRLSAISGRMKNVTFSGCGNTLSAQSKQENKESTLLPE